MKIIRRLTLRRDDGQVYLDRWGIRTRLFGVYLHRMTAPDPGLDLHDHPWPFASIILRGGYTEEVAPTREAWRYSSLAEMFPDTCRRGIERSWRAGTVHRLGLHDGHRIVALRRTPTWTLVLLGRTVRDWGFYEPGHWVPASSSSTARWPLYAENDKGGL